MYNITSKTIIEGYNKNVKRLDQYSRHDRTENRRHKVLNWYTDQIMEQHHERIKKALEEYAINEALTTQRRPALRTRTLFWIGDHMVRWGRRLQAQDSSAATSFGVYINAHR